MNKTNFRFYVCLLIFFCLAVQIHAQQGRTLKWSMSLQNVKTRETIPFGETVQAETGEQFRLIIQASGRSFLYVIAESPETDAIAVLCEKQMRKDETWQSGVLQLTEPQGIEYLFVITSLEEQKDLARSIAAFQNNQGFIQKRALRNEIYRIRSDISQFREAPEKPVLMGGATRGDPERNQGVEFSGLGTYVKTISIEH